MIRDMGRGIQTVELQFVNPVIVTQRTDED